jgi:lysyl-tRNA synthetase class I
MGFLKKLFSGTIKPAKKDYYVFQVKCRRCGEILEGHVDVDNDLSVEYESGGDIYYCRKVLIGNGKNLCFQQIEVGLKFDTSRKLLERRVESGGEFVE